MRGHRSVERGGEGFQHQRQSPGQRQKQRRVLALNQLADRLLTQRGEREEIHFRRDRPFAQRMQAQHSGMRRRRHRGGGSVQIEIMALIFRACGYVTIDVSHSVTPYNVCGQRPGSVGALSGLAY